MRISETDDLPRTGVIAQLDNAGLIDVMGGALRVERAAAHRLFAVGGCSCGGRPNRILRSGRVGAGVRAVPGTDVPVPGV